MAYGSGGHVVTTIREPAREIPVVRNVDVVVVGGPAGLAATASLMACINGFRNQVAPEATQTVRGIAEPF